ncbi:MAG: hypothetical protein ACYDHH_23880 [Solirubrobacteraceae bacterium]
MSSENPRVGEVDPTHIGPPDLILQEIIAPSEVPEDVRKRVETIAEKGERGRVTIASPLTGGQQVAAGEVADHLAHWADVTFAGRALALDEGTDQPDYDDYEDPLVWVFALSADSPVLGEAIVSVGGFASSSSEIRFSKGEPPRRGKRVSLFSAIRTEPRGMPNVHFGRH